MRICIVGCNVNGAYIASKLAKGNEVTVLEKKTQSGDKACSGLISERILKFFPESEDLVENRIKFCNVSFPRKTIKVRFMPDMLAMSRTALDRLASEKARESGAEIRFGNPVKSVLILDGKRPQVLTNDGFEEFDKVIGCDGSMSVVRKSLGLKPPRFRLGIQCFKKNSASSSEVYVYPTKNGFFWKIPRGSVTEYGIIEDKSRAKSLYDEYAKRFKISKLPVEAALIPEGLVVSNADSAALCGDAAGLTKNWSGGGIIWGLTAADILLKSFPNLRLYGMRLSASFKPKLFMSRVITRMAVGIGGVAPQLIPDNINFDGDFALARGGILK